MPRHDIRELNRRAVQACVEVVCRVTAEDLGRPTSCSQWSLGELLAHMTALTRAGRADPGWPR
jgi:Mycothiol maleylpyruvate isomerase N-terminal domain